MKRALAIVLGTVLVACGQPTEPASTAPESIEPVSADPVFPVTSDYLDDHPSRIFQQAATYLENGDMEQATIWFYAGQLRYRVLLDCRALGASAQDLIVFSAQFEIMEPAINGWAAQNLKQMDNIVSDVLAWDESNTDRPAGYDQCDSARNDVRAVYKTIQEAARAQ